MSRPSRSRSFTPSAAEAKASPREAAGSGHSAVCKRARNRYHPGAVSSSSPSSPPSPGPGESFIPYQLGDLLGLCLRDGALPEAEREPFRQFCELFAAYTHFEFHRETERFKESYWCFNPDLNTVVCATLGSEKKAQAAENVCDMFRSLADRANYREVSQAELEQSFQDSTLVELHTDVDLSDFKKVICFARGSSRRMEKVPRMFRQVTVEAEFWERVLLLLHFEDEAHFQNGKAKGKGRRKGTRQELRFSPGKIYAYHYKDVPKSDLELLFPNVRMSMTRKDKIFLSVPAIGAAGAALFKVVGQVALVLVAIAITFGWGWMRDQLDPKGELSVESFAALTAFFTVVLTLGGIAFKQWDKYKNKRNNFLKLVAENLFYRNLATNQAVFSRLIESAEEEECKEAMLVYYHLLAHRGTPMNAEELDGTVERWMKEKFGTVIDFDIAGPIRNLSRIQGRDRAGRTRPLLEEGVDGKLHVLPLADALHLLDERWDKAYEFHASSDR